MQATIAQLTFVSFPFTNPVVTAWMGIGGLLVGLIGIGLAIYYGKRAEKRRIPTFVVQPNSEVLVKKIVMSYPGLSVSFHDQPLTGEGVVATRIQFWNRGSLPIIKSEVLRPYKIVFPEGCRFLDLVLVKESRPEIETRFSVSGEDKRDFVSIDFNILEPRDGMTIQLLYCGPTNAKFEFDGVCVGAHSPDVIDSAFVRYQPAFSRAKGLLVGAAAWVGLFLFLVAHDALAPHHPLLARVFEIIQYVASALLGVFALAAVVYIGYVRLFKTQRVPSTIIRD
jgi:hypothetical protein